MILYASFALFLFSNVQNFRISDLAKIDDSGTDKSVSPTHCVGSKLTSAHRRQDRHCTACDFNLAVSQFSIWTVNGI